MINPGKIPPPGIGPLGGRQRDKAVLFDELDPLERLKNEKFAADGVNGGTSTLRAMRKLQKEALDYLKTVSGLNSFTQAPRPEAAQALAAYVAARPRAAVAASAGAVVIGVELSDAAV